MYTITILKTTIEEMPAGKEWRVIKGKREDDSHEFGYTPEILKKEKVEEEIYQQKVENLDLAGVISIVNKIGSNPVRDGGKLNYRAVHCKKCKTMWKIPPLSGKCDRCQIDLVPGEYKEKPKIRIRSCPKHTHTMYSDCPHCQHDIEKIFGLVHWGEEPPVQIKDGLIVPVPFDPEEKPDDNRKKETIAAVYPVDLKEKAKIKAEINRRLDFICGDLARDGQKEDILKYMPSERLKIRELLEKL